MTATIASLVADHLDLWTCATQRKSGAGRGGGKRISLYGIERLRALILDLAVRGKLVPQDAGDEPASTYLVTASQRVDAASAKGRRKQILPSPDESLELPSGWSPTHLGSIVDIVRGITFPGSEKSKIPEFGRVACLRTSNVQDQIEWDDILYIRDKFVSRADQYVQKNDIIISMANSRELVGKVAIIERDPETPTAFGGFLAAIRAHSVDPRFLMTFLRCPATKAQLIDDASQTTNIANISLSKLNPLPVPLPPLAEQRRIVAKVDELMALCDALERESADAMAAHQALVEALLTTLVNSADAAELATNWARLEQHFDILFTTEASIDALKQTILDLAVRGKLVEQDAGDEAASLTLARAVSAQSRMLESAKRKSRGDFEPSKSKFEEVSPSHWVWAYISDFAQVKGGKRIPKGKGFSAQKTDHVYIRVTDMERGTVNLQNLVYIDAGVHDAISQHTINAADIYVTIAGTIGHVGTVPETLNGQHLTENAAKIVFSEIDQKFLLLVLNADDVQDQFADKTQAMAQPKLALKRIAGARVPIPPLAEQRRIVAKVDELMALCDTLKARITDAAATQKHLADAIVERAAA